MRRATRLQNVVCAARVSDKLEKYLSSLEECLLISLNSMFGFLFSLLQRYEVGSENVAHSASN